MAGVKGRSGGRRPGAGRPKGSKTKPKAEAPAVESAATEPAPAADLAPTADYDSRSYLRHVINDPTEDRRNKLRAAIALAQYEYLKLADGGVKPARQAAAEKAGGGKFAPSAPPTLKRVA